MNNKIGLETKNSTTLQSGILLLNLGTPKSLELRHVRSYLREFLTDPRVITLPWLLRQLLVQLIIVPFRSPKSRHAYQSIWTDQGSPLLVHLKNLSQKCQNRTRKKVSYAMRYQEPSIRSSLLSFRDQGISDITVIPLFPQYSSAAFGSAVEAVYRIGLEFWNTPYFNVIPPFYDHPKFIEALSLKIEKHIDQRPFDKIVFSYHGLPESHCSKSALHNHCFRTTNCCEQIQLPNQHCYRAQCVATTHAVVRRLGLKPDQWVIGFQSRLGRDPWVKPYTDEVLEQGARSGWKNVFVVCPAFVADCLETLEEIGMRAKEDFEKIQPDGHLELIPCLNDDDLFADFILELCRA